MYKYLLHKYLLHKLHELGHFIPTRLKTEICFPTEADSWEIYWRPGTSTHRDLLKSQDLYSQRAIDCLGPAVVQLSVQRRLPRAAHRLPKLPPELGWNRSGQRSEGSHVANGLPELPAGLAIRIAWEVDNDKIRCGISSDTPLVINFNTLSDDMVQL